MAFFTELEQIPKMYTEPQKIQNCHNHPGKKKNKADGITLPDSDYATKLQEPKLHSTGTWTQTHRSMDRNRKPRNKPTTYGQLIYTKTKDTKRIPRNKLNQGGERTIL